MSARDALPITLDGVHYEINLPTYRRMSSEATRQLNDQSGEPSEQTLSSMHVWKRTADDWARGMGQRHFDDYDDSLRDRYRESYSMNVWERGEIQPLRSVAQVVADSTLTRGWLIPMANTILWCRNYLNAGTPSWQLRRVVDPAAATWTFTSVGGGTGYLEGVVWNNRYVYLRTNNAIIAQYSITAGGSVTQDTIGATDGEYERYLYMAGDRIMDILEQYNVGLAGTEFREVKATTNTTIATYENLLNPRFTCAVAGPDGVYLAGTPATNELLTDLSGLKSQIYLCRLNETTGALLPPSPVCQLPDGEVVNTMLVYSNYLVMGTTSGVRIGTFTATGGITYGPLIEVPGAPSSTGVKFDGTMARGLAGVTALEGEGRYVWFSWANFDGIASAGHTGLGRLDLGRFVDDLQPAYALDLRVPGTTGRVDSITTWKGRKFFCVAGVGVYAESTGVRSTAYLNVGDISFGTNEPKVPLSLTIGTNELDGGAAMTVLVLGDGQQIGQVTFTSGSEHVVPLDPGPVQSITFNISLFPGSFALDYPIVYRWVLRGLPRPQRHEEIYLPMVLKETITGRTGPTIPMQLSTEFAALRDLLLTRRPVELVMGAETRRVFVDDILTGVDQAVFLDQWNRDTSFPNGIWFIKCVTLD